MARNEECGECGAFALPGEPLMHYGSCEDHPNNLAIKAKKRADFDEHVSPDNTSVSVTPRPAPLMVFKGEVELKLSPEDAMAAFTYYLTNALNLDNIEVISVTKNAQKQFVVKFKGN